MHMPTSGVLLYNIGSRMHMHMPTTKRRCTAIQVHLYCKYTKLGVLYPGVISAISLFNQTVHDQGVFQQV